MIQTFIQVNFIFFDDKLKLALKLKRLHSIMDK